MEALPKPLDELIPLPEPIRFQLEPGLNEMLATRGDRSLTINLHGKRLATIDCLPLKGFDMPEYRVSFRWMAHHFPSWNRRQFGPANSTPILGTFFWLPREPLNNLDSAYSHFLGIQYRLVSETEDTAADKETGHEQ